MQLSCLLVLSFVILSTIMSVAQQTARNVLGGELGLCCLNPRTGFMRDGFCRTNQWDQGRHLVCARVTDEFLQFTRLRGNDLMTPAPQYQFPGLKPGDKWCLCVLRWKEALDAGVAPPVVLSATHEAALRFVSLEQLQQHALSAEDDRPCCADCADGQPQSQPPPQPGQSHSASAAVTQKNRTEL